MFMAIVTLRDRPEFVGERDGRGIVSPAVKAGTLHIVDLRHSWLFDLGKSPFDSFHIYIPQAAMDEMSAELLQPKVEWLNCPPTTTQLDPTTHGIAHSLIPLLYRPAEGNRLFVDHVFSAILHYLATQYGGLQIEPVKAPALRRRGMLTPLQERDVTSRLLDDLSNVPGVLELATICRLSRSHFLRAFKQSMGLPPHQWLLVKRVERAKVLLNGTRLRSPR
jgi:AraC family transcriptional regulator